MSGRPIIAPGFHSPTRIDDARTLADLVHDCATRGVAIVDYGTSHHGLGYAPPADHIHLQLRGSVIEHYVADFTVRASAGTPIGQLQAALRAHRQFLPIDANDDMTLGECINHNVYGALRVSYGSMRDLILGLHYLDGTGQDIHVGGRTVKNVAGYDVSRFMVGGMGEFGIIHEATVRTYAVPERVLAVDAVIDDLKPLDDGLTAWLVTDAASAHHSLLREGGRWTVRLGYYGSVATCAAQLRAMEGMLEGVTVSRLTATHEISFDQDQAERSRRRAWRRSATAVARIVVPPASTGAVCMGLARWADGLGLGDQFHIHAVPVFGRIFTGGELAAERAMELDQQINQLIAPFGGLRAWHARPPGAGGIEPFAPAQPDWPLLGRIKRAMDPRGIFNPGRFIRGEAAA